MKEEQMKQVQKILFSVFWGNLAAALMLVVLFESDVLPTGTWSGNASAEFLCRCTMEVLSLLFIWLALRLFRFRQVHQDLMNRKSEALRKWGVLRLSMVELPLLVNTLLYYMFMQTTYGYMAIILMLTLPFVYPTLDRCMGDVENDSAEENVSSESQEVKK